MKNKGWGGRDNAAGKAQSEFLQGILKDYDDNVWMLGEGDMRQNTRRKVKGLESTIRTYDEYNNGAGPDPNKQPEAYQLLIAAKAKARALHQLNNQISGEDTAMPGYLKMRAGAQRYAK